MQRAVVVVDASPRLDDTHHQAAHARQRHGGEDGAADRLAPGGLVRDLPDEHRLAQASVAPAQEEAQAPLHPVAVVDHEVEDVGRQHGVGQGTGGPVLRKVVEAHVPSLPGNAGAPSWFSTVPDVSAGRVATWPQRDR
ncbi:hypothetical protein [Ornithinimicrobium kibberense]|uniref:hypothetical protein n=1 Tax=Ornithinimicrobium kibberense TaxID=282060 RepID=UPI0036180667